MPRFMEEDDCTSDRCETCDFAISDANPTKEYRVWAKVRDGAFRWIVSGTWWYYVIDGCRVCYTMAAKRNVAAFLADDDLESALDEIAEVLGVKVAA